MAITISPRILARISAAAEAGDYPDTDTFLEHLIDLYEGGVDSSPESLDSLLAEGLEDIAQGRVQVLDDALWEQIRQEARERFARGERAGPHVRP